jgi:hypothetical protein
MGRHAQAHSTSGLHVKRTANIVQANVQTVQGVLQRHSHPAAQTRTIHLTAVQASIRSTIAWDYMEFGHTSDRGMCCILTAMCEHTGFVELYPMETGKAKQRSELRTH